MLKKIIKYIKRNLYHGKNKNSYQINSINVSVDACKILVAKSILESRRDKTFEKLQDMEFQVFSQWGDDGIIQYLINTLDIPNKTFVEFGVENYIEANTRFLLMNNNWSGLIIDGSLDNIMMVKQSEIFWKYDLQAVASFITQDNINELLSTSGFNKEIGILSIDIDGNDYWVWNKIDCINPVIVIVEYNSVFGSENPWTIPYKHDFYRTESHYSNLYYGSSITSLCDLADRKGYFFVGCNIAGNNAYFIRKDKISAIKPLTASEGYIKSKFKESRDQFGKLSYLNGDERIRALSGLKVYNTRTNSIEVI